MRRSAGGRMLLAGVAAALCAGVGSAQEPGTVLREQKIAWSSGGLAGLLGDSDHFGRALTVLGDLDGDGTQDLAVGAYQDDGGGTNRGALWILFLNPDGTLRTDAKIGSGAGGFLGALSNFDQFGISLALLGDLDGDGSVEVAVGADQDDDGGTNKGAVWILSLDPAGMVQFERKISQTAGGFGGSLLPGDRFGRSVTALGDLDGDGVTELAVGADQDDDGGPNRGAVWILFLNPDGSVRSESKISQTAGGFVGLLDDNDRLGASVCALGDLDGDGLVDLAAGADQDDDGASASGAVWILFLAVDGTVKSHAKVGASSGLPLISFDRFGGALCAPGDFDGDGQRDLVVGSAGDDSGGTNRGAAYVVLLDPGGGTRSWAKLGSTDGNLTGPLQNNDAFGGAVAGLDDLDGDGMLDLVVGADGDDEGGRDRGAVWVLSLQSALVPDEPENSPPTATCSGGGDHEAGVDRVRLGGTVADADGDTLAYAWVEKGRTLASGMIITPLDGSPVDLPVTEISTPQPGEYAYTLTVDDGVNKPLECLVTVQVVDTRAPELAPTVDRSTLWPPNFRMRDVVITTNARDGAGGPVELTAKVTVSDSCKRNHTRNDPDFTDPVIDVASGQIELQLRAERCILHGRTYTIWITATDEAGNSAQASVDVRVEHDRRHRPWFGRWGAFWERFSKWRWGRRGSRSR